MNSEKDEAKKKATLFGPGSLRGVKQEYYPKKPVSSSAKLYSIKKRK